MEKPSANNKCMCHIKSLNPKVIFEFGAAVGQDTLFYRDKFPDADIYSFEPDPLLFKNIKNIMEENNIHFYDYAIRDYTGEMDFYYVRGIRDNETALWIGGFSPHKQKTETNARALGWKVMPEPMRVPCITLEDFCFEHSIERINFIHMDVEGAVHLVLKGMGDLRPELIYAEIEADKYFSGALSPERYTEIFSSMGYCGIEKSGADILYGFKKITKC